MKSIWASVFSAVGFAASAAAQCSSSLSGTFDIHAYDAATSTTTPLNLVAIMTVPHTTFHVLSTSSPTIAWQGLTLSSGVIEAIPPEYYGAVGSLGAAYVNPEYPVPTAGPFPMWANSFVANNLWCATANPDGTATLSLTGHADLFSICESYFNAPAYTTEAVVYDADSSAYGDGPETYNGASCYAVTLLAVPRAS